MFGFRRTNTALVAVDSPKVVTRLARDKAGRQFILTFRVYMVQGEIKAELIKAEPLASTKPKQISGRVSQCSIFAISGCARRAQPNSASVYGTNFVSPYFSLEYLLNSQPTRAPSVR